MVITDRLSRVNWITSVLLPLAVILMEVLWVYSWLVWIPKFEKWPFIEVQSPPLSLVSLVLLFGVSYFTASFFQKRKWPMVWIQLSTVLCGLAVIFLVLRFEYSAGYALFDGQWLGYIGNTIRDIPVILRSSGLAPILIALIIGMGLCWRGIRCGSSVLDFDDIYRSFIVGLFALILLVVVWVASSGIGSLSGLASGIGLNVAGYFFFGLSALAMCNLRAIQRKLTRREGAGTVLNRRWLFIMFLVIGVMTVVGIGLATIFSEDTVAMLGRTMNTVADWLLQGLKYILLPIGYLVEGVFYVVNFFINLIRSDGEPVKATEFNFFAPGEQAERIVPSGLSPAAVLAIKWTVFAIITGLVLFLLFKAVRRVTSSRDMKDIDQTDESVWSWEAFKADIRLLFSLFRRRPKQPKKIPVISEQFTEEIEGTLNIREIYQRLLREASQLRITRKHSETPYEYAVRFSHAVPEGSEYLNELTDVYVHVRYSELDAEEKQIDFANSIWQALKGLLRRLQGV
jgi:hypothetical protein